MVKSQEYEKVTYGQMSKMKHAIGFDKRKIRGTKHRKYEPYRNYYCAGKADQEDWEQLVELGFAEKGREIKEHDSKYYFVTADGRLFIEYVTGVQILEESR